MRMSRLYVIGTPIGNLEDITLRALRILKEVDLILCEDTRVTGKLLAKYEIGTPTMSYHSQSAVSKIDHIIAFLEEGKNLALVSDAGTPAISDPGVVLISKIREHFLNMDEAIEDSVEIVAVPGPSALISALSIAGVPCHEFTFLGFFPHKKGRETLFKEIRESDRTMVFYESPHRIMKTLESLSTHLNDTDKKVIIARELTKVFEQIVRGNAAQVLDYFQKNPDKVRGEFVVIIAT
jgi:16S rRNA (cytidine1402-2'-O)-methyltransferase